MKDHPFGQTGHTPIFTERVVFVQVKDLMNPSAVTVEPTSSAALAARLISRHNVGALPVCAPDRRLRGMVTDRDIVLRCVAVQEDPANTPVHKIMTRNCAVISPTADVREAARIMAARQIRRLPVVEDDKVIGMVSLGDLSQCHSCDMEAGAALSEISEENHHPEL